MERKILIANNKTQQRYTIETNATTLGELKAQMTAQGIDFSGMTFTEGITKTQLLRDDSLLPTNVMHRGQVTNNLVMLLTNPNKQIASGAGMDRKTAYVLVKELGLAQAILECEGQNYTRVKTEVLESYINARNGNGDILNETREELDDLGEENKKSDTSAEQKGIILPDVKDAPNAQTVNWFYDGIKGMVKDSLLHAEDVVVLAGLITELAMQLWETRPVITGRDVDDMMEAIL